MFASFQKDKMVATVTTLSNNVGNEAERNTTGTLTKAEAREALRRHKGNVWAAVTECVEGRQTKVRKQQLTSFAGRLNLHAPSSFSLTN